MELENKREAKVISKNIDVFYGDKQALFGIDLENHVYLALRW